MKSEWEFLFETRGFRFEREHTYNVKLGEPIRLGDRPPEIVTCLVRIVPKDDAPPPYVDQIGSMFVTVPHSESETRYFAFYVAEVVADRITFGQGDFRLQFGLEVCKRIAETPEEEEEFGEQLYSVTMRFQEVVPPLPFDPKGLVKIPLHPKLISQFNETNGDTSPIRQFLGYFRILESVYYSNEKGRPLKQVLTESEDLRQIYRRLGADKPFETFISELVEVRHKCAHLKLPKGFGYVPHDPAIDRELKPHLPILADLAYCAIVGSDVWLI